MAKEKQKRDIWFVINAFTVGLVVLAVMHTIKPYLEPPDPLKPQIMDYAATVKMVDADAAPALLKSTNGKPTLLVVYASWCGYCRMKMPDIISLMREGKLAHVNVLLLSRDKSLMDLSKYLVHSGFYKDFTAIMMRDDGAQSFSEILYGQGSAYRGTIPFLEVFDPAGKAVRQIPHTSDKDVILAATKNL